MDKPILIIEAPELDADAVARVYEFLQELVLGFEAHYYSQLARRERNRQGPDLQSYENDDEHFNDEIPF